MRKLNENEMREVAAAQNPYSDWYCYECHKKVPWWKLSFHMLHWQRLKCLG